MTPPPHTTRRSKRGESSVTDHLRISAHILLVSTKMWPKKYFLCHGWSHRSDDNVMGKVVKKSIFMSVSSKKTITSPPPEKSIQARYFTDGVFVLRLFLLSLFFGGVRVFAQNELIVSCSSKCVSYQSAEEKKIQSVGHRLCSTLTGYNATLSKHLEKN